MKYLLIFSFIVLLVQGLECTSDEVYLAVTKHNSASRFNQRHETFEIRGTFNTTTKTLVKQYALNEFRAIRTYEYCLRKTVDLVYDLALLDDQGDGWDDGSFIEAKSDTGFVFFKGHCTTGYEEIYRIRMTYLISPYQNWGVLPGDDAASLWKNVDESTYIFDNFDQDWIKEDENSPSYVHEVTGYPSDNNYYINRFPIRKDDHYSALEIGMTNDFNSVAIYINNICVFNETDHMDNKENYYRILIKSDTLIAGLNIIIFEFDKQEHMNNVYLYGYPSYNSQNCMYVHSSSIEDHSDVVQGHDINRAFDYSNEYFYFEGNKNIFLTAYEMTEYTVYDYVYAYAPRNWTLSGSHDGKTWNLIDRRDEPSVDHILRKYTYRINQNMSTYNYYKYCILDNKGYQVTWLPELYPYVCTKSFDAPIYRQIHYHITYNNEFEIKSKLPEGVKYTIEPALPQGVTMDDQGTIRGVLDYTQEPLQYYTVTAYDDEHENRMVITMQLREGYDYDFYIANMHIVFNNFFARTPLFVLFIVCGLTLALVFTAINMLIENYY